jgi:hypothetical protein
MQANFGMRLAHARFGRLFGGTASVVLRERHAAPVVFIIRYGAPVVMHRFHFLRAVTGVKQEGKAARLGLRRPGSA